MNSEAPSSVDLLTNLLVRRLAPLLIFVSRLLATETATARDGDLSFDELCRLADENTPVIVAQDLPINTHVFVAALLRFAAVAPLHHREASIAPLVRVLIGHARRRGDTPDQVLTIIRKLKTSQNIVRYGAVHRQEGYQLYFKNQHLMKQGLPIDVPEFLKMVLESAADQSDQQSPRFLTASVRHLFNYMEASGYSREGVAAVIEKLKSSPDVTLQLLAAGKDQELHLRDRPLDMHIMKIDGQPLDLATLRGQIVLVDVWSTSCSSCIAALPNHKTVYDKYRGMGFQIVGIHLWGGKDEEKGRREALSILSKTGGDVWINACLDKQESKIFTDQYGITGVPVTWLFSQMGMFVTSEVREEHLESEVRRLLGLSPLSTGSGEVNPLPVKQGAGE